MKTIRDAVIEFKGEWPFGMCNSIIFGKQDQGYNSFHRNLPEEMPNSNWHYVCSREGFGLYATELSHHKGEDLFNKYVKADKKPAEKESKVDYTSEELWKNAPEGATHYGAENESYGAAWYKDVNKNTFTVWPISHGKWHKSLGDGGSLFDRNLIERPKPQPIFTKAMSDAGERAPIGSTVDVEGVHYELVKYVIRSNTSFALCVEVTGLCSYMFNLSELEPIDTRTDKEKAMQDMKESYIGKDPQRNLTSEFPSVVCDIFEAISSGNIHGVTWSGNNE